MCTKKSRLYYAPGNKISELKPNATLLVSIRAAGIPHASVCGGRGRYSTCQVLIGKGLEGLPPASEQEVKILSRITKTPLVRLTCRLHPTNDVEITALVKLGAGPDQAARRSGYSQGREVNVAFLFVDLRGLTKLSEERLPFNVTFILSLFFLNWPKLCWRPMATSPSLLETAYEAPQNKAVLKP